MSRDQQCPICKSTVITEFLVREAVPLHQNLLIKSQSVARGVERGDLRMVLCRECGFIFNSAFDFTKLSYGLEYENTQSFSPAFDEYLDNLARQLIFEKGVKNCRIVEVGCGKGGFLKKLVQQGTGNTGYGFDPSYVGPETDLEGRVRFERSYYGPRGSDIAADVVICRHVIEHVPDPLSLIGSVRQAITNSPNARVFFETPCVEWILRNRVIWDFFYEHCSYFTSSSLSAAFAYAGFTVNNVEHIFGGQYLWLEAVIAKEPPTVKKDPGLLAEAAAEYAASEAGLKSFWQKKVDELRSQGGVAIWGAGAKGVTFANLVDPECNRITCVVDVNPQKQGGFLAGTGHPIVDYHELKNRGVAAAVLMNPVYKDEVAELLNDANLKIDLV